MREILEWSGLEIAERIRRRDVSSLEVTRFFLERIERLDGQLHSFVTVLRRRAELTARWRDRRPDDSVFCGVPTGLKDLVPMLGTPTKLGSRAYRWLVSPFSVRAAKLIGRGGFVVLGKLSTSEFGVLPVTEPDIHPPTRNPWNPEHTPGGSSGGSGAAVAAKLVPLAQGSDGGGSVRIPASLCHLYGFKPSLSLLGNLHGRVNKLGMSVMGPLCHDVEDAAALLDVLRGDAFPHRDRDGESCLARCRRPPPRLRIRVVDHPPLGRSEPEVVAAVRATARLLESLGHRVVDGEMIRADLEEFLPLWQYMLAQVPTPGDRWLQPVTRWLRAEGRRLDPDRVKAQQRALTTRLDEVFGDADVLLSPTVPIFPPRIGQHAALDPQALFHALAPLGAFTAAFNISRGPAATLPAAVSEHGFPIGVQLGGRRGQDHLVLSLSKELEAAMPWRHRHEPRVL